MKDIIKFIGYFLISLASIILSDLGYGVATWQWWVIVGGLIIGCALVRYKGDE